MYELGESQSSMILSWLHSPVVVHQDIGLFAGTLGMHKPGGMLLVVVLLHMLEDLADLIHLVDGISCAQDGKRHKSKSSI